MKSWLKYILGICAVVFFLGFFVVGVDLYHLLYRPMLQPLDKAIVLRLDKSASATSFVNLLQSKHLIQSKKLFLLLIRLQGLSQQLKAGIYQLQPGESAQQFLFRVIDGGVLSESFRIIEGTNQKQVAKNLAQASYLAYKETDWSLIKGQYLSAEGLLLADTYNYKADSSSKVLLTKAQTSLNDYLQHCWQQRASNLPYKTPYHLLIVASILEKETALPAERHMIAGVIINRLRKNMPLQMDPTVIYALGDRYTGRLTHNDMKIDSPYNTYIYRGLPPTPIAMVGKSALDAAAHPAQTDYLYFVAKGDGSHQFSVTYDEQRRAIARFMRK